MIRVARCMKDFARNSDLAEELAALPEGDDHIALFRNIHIVIRRLCPGLHERDGVDLDIEHEEGNAFLLQFLGKARMVNVIVGGERVADLAQGHARPLEVRLHDGQSPRPADVNEQARGARADNPVVG